ncbi:AsnC family transcriptional regulator, partial [Brevibacterium paucivorans]
MFDAEVNLARQVAFIDQLAQAGALTEQEANTVLARITDESAAVVGVLIVRV